MRNRNIELIRLEVKYCELWWPGVSQNRRHGDFSVPHAAQGP